MEQISDNTTYSIIIATYNRLPELKELIASVGAFDFPQDRFELLIVDDGSNDGTRTYLENLQPGFQLRTVYQENQGPGAARNHGMREAAGEYFLFIDSDCIIPADYLSKVDQFLQDTPVDAFGGPDDCHPDFPPLLKAINYSMTSFLGTGGTRGGKKAVTRFYPRSFNMGIHRRVYQQVGGMNALRHGQDMDFSARIYAAGFDVALIPDAFVYHKRRTNLRRFFKQIFNWGVARINLGRLHDNMLKPVHFAPAIVVSGTILVLLLALIAPFFQPLFWFMMGGITAIAGIAFGQSYSRYKSSKVAALSIVTLFIQVYAYGLGVISGLLQWARGRQEAVGYSKNYYK